jgi:hypothetical protein
MRNLFEAEFSHIDLCEQPKHIRGPHKNVSASLRSSNRLLQSLKTTYVGAGTMDQ